MPDELSAIDRAKEIVNERVMSLLGGEIGGHADTAPLWIGMPITHDEGAWIAAVAVRESIENMAAGQPVVDVLQGMLEWALLVGIVAGLKGAK